MEDQNITSPYVEKPTLPTGNIEQGVRKDLKAMFFDMGAEEKRKFLMHPKWGNATFREKMIPSEQTKFINHITEDTIGIAALFDKGQIPQDAPEYTTAQSIYLKAEPFVKPIADTTAMTGGAMIGAPSGPLGAAGGAGLMLGMERNVIKTVEQLIGLRENLGLAHEGLEALQDITEGFAFETGGQALPVVAGAVKRGAKSLFSKSTLTAKGAKFRAKKVLNEELAGTARTQPQINRNIKEAKSLQTKVREIDPDFTFTNGQLTNDASTIALERSLGKGGGQDLTQTQRATAVQALRQYYNRKMLSTGTPEDYVTYIARMQKELESSTRQGVKAVEAEVTRLSSHLEPQVVGGRIFDVLSTGKRALKKQAKSLYDKIPNLPLKTDVLAKSIRSFVKAEDGIIEPRAKEMISLINKKISDKIPAVVGKLIDPITGQAAINIPAEIKPTGYQVLRRLHSKVASSYRAANSGANPNLEDARQLFRLQGLLDDTMRQMEKMNPSAAKAYKKATSFYKETYIPTYRQGTVADVLQRGARGEETKIARAVIAKEFDSLDGIDDFIRAVGKDTVARGAMRDYYKYTMLERSVNTQGEVVGAKALQWLARNAGKLKKLGLYDEFKTLGQLKSIADDAAKTQKVFAETVANRVLNVDIDKFIAKSFSDNHNIRKSAIDLMEMAKGDKTVEGGLQNAFSNHLMAKTETAAPEFFDDLTNAHLANSKERVADLLDKEFIRSVTKLTNLIKKFRPAIKIIYKKDPAKIKALNDYWKGLTILERTAKSPTGAGSPTAELIFGMNKLGRAGGFIVGGVVPKVFYPYIVVRNLVQKFGLQNTEKYLTRALFDPDYAAVMNDIVRKNGLITPKATPIISRLMKRLLVVTTITDSNVLEEEEKRKALESQRLQAVQ